MQNKELTFAAEIKADDDGEGSFTGLASTFGNTDLTGDIIAPGAFAASLKKRPAKRIRMLWQHRSDEPIGVYTEMAENDKGLKVSGQLIINKSVPTADKAHALMAAGALDSLSIGFQIPEKGSEFDRETGIRTLHKIDLLEVSIVTFPANPKARISTVKEYMAGDNATRREMEMWLTCEGGLTRKEARALLSGGFDEFVVTQDADDDNARASTQDAGDGLGEGFEALAQRFRNSYPRGVAR